jgi:hypothetical protein
MMHVPKPVDPAELVAVVAALARANPEVTREGRSPAG